MGTSAGAYELNHKGASFSFFCVYWRKSGDNFRIEVKMNIIFQNDSTIVIMSSYTCSTCDNGM